MNGLEKITAKIREDSENRCRIVSEKAAEEAEAIHTRKAEETAILCRSIAEEAEEKRKRIAERAASGAEQIRKQTILSAKVNAIHTVLTDALSVLDELECEKYFDALLTLLQNNIQRGACLLWLNERDMNRKPADFKTKAESTAQQAGAALTLSSKPAAIQNGFVLQYGDMEINCSFPALFREMQENLKEKADYILFREDELC